MDIDQSPEKYPPSEPYFFNTLTYRLPVVHTDSAPNPLVHCLNPPLVEEQQKSITPVFLPPSVGDSEDGTIMSYASDDAAVFSDTPFPFDDYLPTADCTSHNYEGDSTSKNVSHGIEASYGSVTFPSYSSVDESNSYFVELTQQSFVAPSNIVSSNQMQNACFQPCPDTVGASCGSSTHNVPAMWQTGDTAAVTAKDYHTHLYFERQNNQSTFTNSDPHLVAYPEPYPTGTLKYKTWEEGNQYSMISSYVSGVSTCPSYSIPNSIPECRSRELGMYDIPPPAVLHPNTNSVYHVTQAWACEQQPNVIYATQDSNHSVHQLRTMNVNELYNIPVNETGNYLPYSMHLTSASDVKSSGLESTGYWDPNISAQVFQPSTHFERGTYSRELTEILPSNGINDSHPSHIDPTIHLNMNPVAPNVEHGYEKDPHGIFVEQMPYNPVNRTGVHDPNTFAFSSGITQTSATAQTENEFRCSHCSRTFQRPSHLEMHVRTHTGERPYACILCGRHFSQVSNLRRHMESHKAWPPDTSTTLPSLCSMQSNLNQTVSSNAYTTTQTPANRKLRQWNCRFCLHTFDNYLSLRAHMTEHKEMRVFACVFQSCTCTFQTADDLFVHIMEHHRDLTDFGSTCPTCSRTFSDVRQLAQHWLPRRRGLPPRCRPSAMGCGGISGTSQRQAGNSSQLSGRSWRSALAGLPRTRHPQPLSRRGRRLVPRHRLSVRLLRLRGSANVTKLRVFRCPLCSKRCRSLHRLRQHLATAEHAEELAAVVRQSSVSSLNSSNQETGDEIAGQPDVSAVQKTALFLIQLEEDSKVGVDRGTGVEATGGNNKSDRSLCPGRSTKIGQFMACSLCGKQFQKLKFFEDHQLMCQQAVDERARRKRLREQRKANFRVLATDSAGPAVDSAECSVYEGAPGGSMSSLGSCESALFDLSSSVADTSLRRSSRQRCFQQHWNAKKPRGFEHAKQTS